MRELNHYINGKRTPASARQGDVFNPANGQVKARVSLASTSEVEQAVAAAKSAFPAWAATPAAKRAAVMFRFRDLILEHIDELAELVSSEHGKVLTDAKGSIMRGLEVVEFSCGLAHHLGGMISKNVAAGIDTYDQREPLGVVAGITPFNFPAMVPMWMFPIALMCGNTFVLKPSERIPSCPLRLVELMSEAGLPEGCLNLVNGDKESVECLTAHPDVQAVSFVGSSSIAHSVSRAGAEHGKRVQALGGAKNHMVVLPDADLDLAANAAIGAAYGSAGERCMAISVLVAVGDEVADALIKKLVPRVQSLKVGAYDDPNAEMGPLVSADAKQRVERYIASGLEAGADLLVDGRTALEDNPRISSSGGFFIGGSLFDRVTPKMQIYQEEIFGPVLCVVRVSSLAQAIDLLRNHQYGNGAAVFTNSGAAARTFTDSVDIGMIGVNVPIPVPAAFHSFGGWKNSIFSDHAIYGLEGLRFYTRLKTITQRWSGIEQQNSAAVFHFRPVSD